MLFSRNNLNSKLKPRSNSRRFDEIEMSAQVQLEQREMLAGLQVGDIYLRDSNPNDTFEVTGQTSDSKFTGKVNISSFNLDVTIKLKKNGSFIVKAKSDLGSAKVKATPIANTDPQQVQVKGKLNADGFPTFPINETFTLKVINT